MFNKPKLCGKPNGPVRHLMLFNFALDLSTSALNVAFLNHKFHASHKCLQVSLVELFLIMMLTNKKWPIFKIGSLLIIYLRYDFGSSRL